MKVEAIKNARTYSAKLERLLKAKMQLSELLYVCLSGDPFLEEPLKEAMGRLNGKIFTLKRAITREMSKVISSEKYVIPSYITSSERKSGFVDITKLPEKEEVFLLDLNSGEVVENSKA